MLMRFSPDQPIRLCEEDALGFQAFVETIANSLKYTKPPFVFGILGDWGSGKTSIMNMICEMVSSKDFTAPNQMLVPIWFDAWRYENETNVVYPLLHAIYENLTERLHGHPKAAEKLEQFKKLLSRVARGSLLALSDLGLRVATHHFIGETMNLKDVQQALEQAEKDERLSVLETAMEKWADEVGQLNQAFGELLACYAKTLGVDPEYVRFVIFVDDLDRCLPETVIRILESIKNFLTTPNTIFVLGINPRVVYQGIRSKYPSLNVDGREYLEKIINYSYFVPEPDTEAAAGFALKNLKQLTPDQDSSQKSQDAFDIFDEVLRSSRFNNPRKIKRLLNRYLLFLSDRQNSRFNNHDIVRLMVLAEYFPSLFSIFLSPTRDAKEVQQDLITPDATKFEQKYGVPITPLLRQIVVMKGLFNFQASDRQFFRDHVEAVFKLTHSTHE